MPSTTNRTLLLTAGAALLLAGVGSLFFAAHDSALAPASRQASRPETGDTASAAEAAARSTAEGLATRDAGGGRDAPRKAVADGTGKGSFALDGRIAAPAGADPSRGEIRVFRGSEEPQKKLSFHELMRSISEESSDDSRSDKKSGKKIESRLRSRRADGAEKAAATGPIAGDGTFSLPDVGFGRMELLLHHPHLYLVEPLVLAAGADGVAHAGTIEPKLGGAISGTVSLPDGAPAPLAEVAGACELNPMDFMSSGGAGGFSGIFESQLPRETKCDAQGRFALWGLPAGKRFILVARNGKEAPVRSEVTTVAGATVQADFRLLIPATLTCTVSASTTLIEKAEVDLAPQAVARHPAPGLDQSPSVTTDAAGIARFAALAPGSYRLTVTARGFKQSETVVELGPGEDRRIAVEQARGNSIAGTVADQDGKPLEGASVGASPLPAMKIPVIGDLSDLVGDDMLALMVGHSPNSEKTAADGTFRLHGLEDDPVDVIVTMKGYAPTRVREVKPGSENVRIVLGPAGAVAGRITSEDTGKPVPSFTADVTVRVFMVMDRPVRSVTGTETADGKFLIEGIAPGSYSLKVQAEGFAAHSCNVDVVGGETTDAGQIRLLLPARIRGVVVDGSGAAVAGAQVRKRRGGVADFAMLDGFFETERTVSDERGDFEITGLAPGQVSLEAIKEGFAPSSSERIKVEKGKVAGPVRLVLQEGGSIAGVLETKQDSAKKASVKWIVTATSQRPMHSAFKEPDGAGKFRFEHLPPGVYDVAGSCLPEEGAISGTKGFKTADFKQQMREAMESAKEQIHRRVTVRNGETAEVVLGNEDGKRAAGVVWTGTVLSALKPVPDAMLMVTEYGAEPVPRIAMADERGRFKIDGLQPGRHRVEVRTSFFGGGHQHGTDVTIPAAGSFQHDLEVPTGSLAGRVVTRGSRKPIRGTSVILRNTSESRRDSATESMMPSFAISDRDGGFRFSGLADATYELEASDLLGLGGEQKPSTARLTGLAVRGGEELLDLLLEVSAGASVEAQITDPGGAPTPGAELWLLDGAGKPLALRFPAASDGNGRAILSSLAPGKYQAVASSALYACAFSGPFELQENGTAELAFTLARGVEVEVEVQGDGGKALAGARVLVEDERGRWMPIPMAVSIRSALAGPGVQAVGRLAPGRYRFVVEHRSIGSRTIEQTVPDGATARIVLKL